MTQIVVVHKGENQSVHSVKMIRRRLEVALLFVKTLRHWYISKTASDCNYPSRCLNGLHLPVLIVHEARVFA